MLTMLDGQPVPMTVAVDDIILKAEESGLICNAVEESSGVMSQEEQGDKQ